MRTKFHIIIGNDSHEVAPTDIKNWDEVKFTLERKDFSGVMRSFSSDFEFVGDAFILLRDLYLQDGFLASAEIAVSTKNNDWTYTEQFRCPLDFSTIEIENGVMSISSIDNTLSGLIKAQKSTKYQFDLSDFDTQRIEVQRIAISNSQHFAFLSSDLSKEAYVDLQMTNDLIVTTQYIEPKDETHSEPANSHFAKVVQIGATMSVYVNGLVRCYLSPTKKGLSYSSSNMTIDIPVAQLQIRTLEADQSNYRYYNYFFDDDLMYKRIHGTRTNMFINRIKENVFGSLQDLKSTALSYYGGYGYISNDYNGIFGIVRGEGGSDDPGYSPYWQHNTVYEYQNGNWINKGAPEDYYQDRNVTGSISLDTSTLTTGYFVQMWCNEQMKLQYASMRMEWSDPVGDPLYCRAITPLSLINKIVQAISPTASVTIAEDGSSRMVNTYIVPGEELRQITGAKVYSTFQQFADWIEAVFGYTYRIKGSVVQFAHRSAIFGSDVVKMIEDVREVKYSVNDDLIYAEVQAGYSKKEYGEINGRYETNFTNYYTTGYNATDKKLQLISKYRADSYGIEYTARKSESESKDDKADEDVFVLKAVSLTGHSTLVYITGNTIYNPANCISCNAAYIAALGNGAAVTLTMTSSDGNNALTDVAIAANTALFTAGVLEFKTDDMILPEDWDGLIQIDHAGYRFRGYISKAEATYGRTAGVEYSLIVKDITEL